MPVFIWYYNRRVSGPFCTYICYNSQPFKSMHLWQSCYFFLYILCVFKILLFLSDWYYNPCLFDSLLQLMSQVLGVFEDPTTGVVCLIKQEMVSFLYPASFPDSLGTVTPGNTRCTMFNTYCIFWCEILHILLTYAGLSIVHVYFISSGRWCIIRWCWSVNGSCSNFRKPGLHLQSMYVHIFTLPYYYSTFIHYSYTLLLLHSFSSSATRIKSHIWQNPC